MKGNDVCKKLSLALAKGRNTKEQYREYFQAAVLVPLIWQNDQLSILFEVRSSKLSWQPGEICFPGGRIEDKDTSPMSAAVRETVEELSLPESQVQVLGPLQEVVSPIGVRLHPFAAYITDIREIKPNVDEVANIFTVPLHFLLQADPIVGHMERCTRPANDFPYELLPEYSANWQKRKKYQVLFYKYEEYVIWGLTAQVLYDFLEVYKQL